MCNRQLSITHEGPSKINQLIVAMRYLGKQRPHTLGQVNMDGDLKPREDSTAHPSHDFSQPCQQYTETRSILEAKNDQI